MIKVNLAQENMTLVEALNAALDVAGHVKGSVVFMEYQGAQFSIVMNGSLAVAPRIIEPRRIADFDDEVLFDEFHRRTVEACGVANCAIEATQLFNLLTFLKQLRK